MTLDVVLRGSYNWWQIFCLVLRVLSKDIRGPSSWWNCVTGETTLYCLEWWGWELVSSCAVGILLNTAEDSFTYSLHTSSCFLIFHLFSSLLRQKWGNWWWPHSPTDKIFCLWDSNPSQPNSKDRITFTNDWVDGGQFCWNQFRIQLQCYRNWFWDGPEVIFFSIMDVVEQHLCIAKESCSQYLRYALPSGVATSCVGCWALEMWLVHTEMCVKYTLDFKDLEHTHEMKLSQSFLFW